MMWMKNERTSEQWSRETTLYYSYTKELCVWGGLQTPLWATDSIAEQPKSPQGGLA